MPDFVQNYQCIRSFYQNFGPLTSTVAKTFHGQRPQDAQRIVVGAFEQGERQMKTYLLALYDGLPRPWNRQSRRPWKAIVRVYSHLPNA